MAVAVTVDSMVDADPGAGLDSTRDSLLVTGTLTLSGNYGTGSSDGDVMDLSGLCASSLPPKWVRVYQEPTAGVAPVIYCFLWARGSTQANGLLQVTDFAGVQITDGAAYPAALTSTEVPPNIRFEASFVKNI